MKGAKTISEKYSRKNVNSEALKTLSLLRGRKAQLNSDGSETSLIQGSTSGTQLKVAHKNFSKSQSTPFSSWCIVSIGLLSGKFSIIANNVEAKKTLSNAFSNFKLKKPIGQLPNRDYQTEP